MRRFTVHNIDSYNFLLKLDELDAAMHVEIHRRLLRIPEVKFSAKLGGYSVPQTARNIEYLNAYFKDEFELDELSDLKFVHTVKTLQLQDLKLAQRLTYIQDQSAPEVKYPCRLKPFNHQAVATTSIHGSEFFALLMGMGTGKTKCLIDEVNWLGECRMIVICPKSVTGQWIKEFAKHCTVPYWIARLKSHHRGVSQLVEGLRVKEKVKVWIINYDRVKTMGEYLAKIKPTICVLDESHSIKNRKAKRTKACIELGQHCERRFIFTGTPVANTLLDLFSQFNFLSAGSLGYASYKGFEQRFARFKKMRTGFDKLVGYKYVEELKTAMAKCSFTVKKSECLDLPPKMYVTRSIEMTEKQSILYEQMLTIALASLESDLSPENTVHATIVLVQMLRLSQIANGFLKTLTGEEKDIPGGNPKIDALSEIIDEVHPDEKIVIWARFHKDVDNITALLEKKRIRHTDLTGRSKNRDANMDSFNSDHGARILIGEPGSGGLGVELLGTKDHPCTTVIYFSNDYSSTKRQQSEERSHRIGVVRPVTYIDLVAEGTIEERITEILQKKKQLNEFIKDFKGIRTLLTGENWDDTASSDRKTG